MKNLDNQKKIITFLKNKHEYGGPGTFLSLFSKWLDNNNIGYDFFPNNNSKKIFIFSSTKKIFFLIFKKLCGYKIIQRLDGYLWDQIYQNNKRLLYKYILINFLMNFIRKFLADEVIYQSNYLKQAWEKKFSKIKRFNVILNATDNLFFLKRNQKKTKKFKIISVEGEVQNNFYTLNLLRSIALVTEKNPNIESFHVYGKYPKVYKKKLSSYVKTCFKGAVNKNEISKIYNDQNLIFFVLEQYPACPNSVIEAVASNTIVIGFNNGSLLELLENKIFLIEFQNINKLKNFNYVMNLVQRKINFTIINFNSLRNKLRLISKKFRLENMSKKYLNVINN